MRHGLDSRETLGKLGPPWSGDLLAGGSTGQNILGTEVHTRSLHAQADVVWSTWGQRPAEAGKSYAKLSGNSDHLAQSEPKGAQFASSGAQGSPS